MLSLVPSGLETDLVGHESEPVVTSRLAVSSRGAHHGCDSAALHEGCVERMVEQMMGVLVPHVGTRQSWTRA